MLNNKGLITIQLALRDIDLRQEYRSDRDDLISEFFVPCLSNCIQFDRSIEFVTAKSVTALLGGFRNIANVGARLRIITGHRFAAEDLHLMTKILSDVKKNKQTFNNDFPNYEVYDILKKIIQNKKLEIKIAIPRLNNAGGFFVENIGIFRDLEGDAIVFRGTSSQTFSRNGNFESIDVFTSWNEKSRVERKILNFEDLWNNKTRNVEVYDFSDAERNRLLRYDFQGLLDKVF